MAYWDIPETVTPVHKRAAHMITGVNWRGTSRQSTLHLRLKACCGTQVLARPSKPDAGRSLVQISGVVVPCSNCRRQL